MKICPLCNTPLQRLVGLEGYKVVMVLVQWSGQVEQKRMDVIHVCNKCEHCE